MNKTLEEIIEERANKMVGETKSLHPGVDPGLAFYIGYTEGAEFALTPKVLIKVDEVKGLVDALSGMERLSSIWLPTVTDEEHSSEAEALHQARSAILKALAPFAELEGEVEDE